MKPRVRKLNNELHRDVGYFFSSLIILYALSGIALNHVDDWNPDFIIQRTEFALDNRMQHPIGLAQVEALNQRVGEEKHKIFDQPSPDKVKVYYEDATLMVDLVSQTAQYERISKRPLFYQANVLHRNSVAGWKWVSDVFALMLILLSVTGLFVLRGKNGFWGRGKWFVAAGALPPLVVLIIQLVAV